MNRTFSIHFLLSNCDLVTVHTDCGESHEIHAAKRNEEKQRWSLKPNEYSTAEYEWVIPDQSVELGQDGCCEVIDEDGVKLKLSFTQVTAQGPDHFNQIQLKELWITHREREGRKD